MYRRSQVFYKSAEPCRVEEPDSERRREGTLSHGGDNVPSARLPSRMNRIGRRDKVQVGGEPGPGSFIMRFGFD